MSFLLGLGVVTTSRARTIYVDDDGPADFNTIQAAINDANDGDVIVVKPGRYTGDGNRNIDYHGKAITVRSVEPNDIQTVAVTIIDCNGTVDPDRRRGFYFHNDEGPDSVLDGLTITNGAAYFGGGIWCDSSPTVSNCIISNNKAVYGNCVWGPCPSDGGGMACRDCDGRPRIINCRFISNWASGMGGALAVFAASPRVTDCSFTANSADRGGAIASTYGSATFIGCTFNANSAGVCGGGMYTTGMDTGLVEKRRLINCLFSGNSAEEAGGAAYVDGSHLAFANCTFAGNWAPHGSGMTCYSWRSWSQKVYPGKVDITNCIFWNHSDEILNDDGSTIALTFGNVQGGRTEIYDPCEGLLWGVGNVDVEPYFVRRGYWADVSDSNVTAEPNDPNAVWFEGDYHLRSQADRWDLSSRSWVKDDLTSPCIDAGDPMNPIGLEPFPNGGIVNMGAYGGTAEASESYFGEPVCEIRHGRIAGDINGDCKVDHTDLATMALHWLGAYRLPAPSPPPEVGIGEPRNGQVVGINHPNEPIVIKAGGRDPDGWIMKVEFFIDGSEVDVAIGKIGEDTDSTDGWQIGWVWWGKWGHYPEGWYTLTVKATDDSGVTASSRPVRFYVHGPK